MKWFLFDWISLVFLAQMRTRKFSSKICWPLSKILLGDTSCPSGCECIGFEQCKWSGQTVRIIAGLPPQTPAWFWYAFLFQNDICDRGNRKVCCCGVKQIGTAEFKMQPKDCEWGPYKPQGECSKPCDGGVQTMKRLKTKKAHHGK